MLKIRLARIGKKYEPHYRLVVMETRSKRNGKVVDDLGTWQPKGGKLVIDRKTYSEWIAKGAQASQALSKLLDKSEII